MLIASHRDIAQESNTAQVTGNILGTLWNITMNAKELIIRPSEAILSPLNAIGSRTTLLLTAFFGSEAGLV